MKIYITFNSSKGTDTVIFTLPLTTQQASNGFYYIKQGDTLIYMEDIMFISAAN